MIPGLRERLAALVRLGRPKFLVYSAVLVALGGAIAARAGRALDAERLLQTLALVWTAHLMTHYANDYFDLEADRANPGAGPWTGGSRVLVEERLAPSTAIRVAVLLLLSALAQAWILPAPARWLALAGIALGWFYTAPPLRLNYRGYGELTVSAVLIVFIPLLAILLQGGTFGDYPWPIMAPLFLIQFVRMNLMNLADHEGDEKVGKATAAVKLGPERIRVLHAAGQALALAWVVAAWRMGFVSTSVAMGFTLAVPLGLWQAWRVLRDSGSNPEARPAGRSRAPGADNVAFWATNHAALAILGVLAGYLHQLPARPPALLLAPLLLIAVMTVQIWSHSLRGGAAAKLTP